MLCSSTRCCRWFTRFCFLRVCSGGIDHATGRLLQLTAHAEYYAVKWEVVRHTVCGATLNEPHLLPKAIRGLLCFVPHWQFGQLREQDARSRHVLLDQGLCSVPLDLTRPSPEIDRYPGRNMSCTRVQGTRISSRHRTKRRTATAASRHTTERSVDEQRRQAVD